VRTNGRDELLRGSGYCSAQWLACKVATLLAGVSLCSHLLIGPAVALGGQRSTDGPEGGKILALMIEPTDPRALYAEGRAGGRSTLPKVISPGPSDPALFGARSS